MECFDCHHHNPRGAKFCVNCGKSFTGSGKGSRHTHTHTPNPAYPNTEAINQLAQSLAVKRKSQLYLRIAAAAVFLLGLLGALTAAGFLSFWVSVVAVIFILNKANGTPVTLAAEYYALPGSRDQFGEHRCIQCGGRGQWKSTPYATNSTAVACSTCKAHLFIE
jgi:uncharacterized membrane protein